MRYFSERKQRISKSTVQYIVKKNILHLLKLEPLIAIQTKQLRHTAANINVIDMDRSIFALYQDLKVHESILQLK